MEITHITNITLSMREFQKINGVTRQCVTNTQYLYDTIKSNTNSNVKVQPVIVISTDVTTLRCIVHLVVVLDDKTIIDPSYDVFSLNNKSYYDNIKDFMFNVRSTDRHLLKKSITDFICFIKLAERINNGELLICDILFYNQQADYIEKNVAGVRCPLIL